MHRLCSALKFQDFRRCIAHFKTENQDPVLKFPSEFLTREGNVKRNLNEALARVIKNL